MVDLEATGEVAVRPVRHATGRQRRVAGLAAALLGGLLYFNAAYLQEAAPARSFAATVATVGLLVFIAGIAIAYWTALTRPGFLLDSSQGRATGGAWRFLGAAGLLVVVLLILGCLVGEPAGFEPVVAIAVGVPVFALSLLVLGLGLYQGSRRA